MRETTVELSEAPNPHIQHAVKPKSNDDAAKDNEYEKFIHFLVLVLCLTIEETK